MSSETKSRFLPQPVQPNKLEHDALAHDTLRSRTSRSQSVTHQINSPEKQTGFVHNKSDLEPVTYRPSSASLHNDLRPKYADAVTEYGSRMTSPSFKKTNASHRSQTFTLDNGFSRDIHKPAFIPPFEAVDNSHKDTLRIRSQDPEEFLNVTDPSFTLTSTKGIYKDPRALQSRDAPRVSAVLPPAHSGFTQNTVPLVEPQHNSHPRDHFTTLHADTYQPRERSLGRDAVAEHCPPPKENGYSRSVRPEIWGTSTDPRSVKQLHSLHPQVMASATLKDPFLFDNTYAHKARV